MVTTKKLVVTCKTLPPLVIGSTVLMANLFNNYQGELEALAGWEYGAKADPKFSIKCKAHYLRFSSFLQRIMDKYSGLYFYFIKKFVYKKLKELSPAAVFAACTPDGLFFVASYIACKRLNIPFWGHMHDLWEENTPPNSFNNRLAKIWEADIFNNADTIFCMTDHQADYYSKKYGRTFPIAPHCIENSDTDEAAAMKNVEMKALRKRKKILYTGNISNHMNLDAMQVFVSEVTHFPEEWEVTILCSYSKEQLISLGLYNSRINYAWVSKAQSFEMVKDADVLFLPLSFKNCSINEVSTVFATKTLDYLISGTPILVYSPSESFHTASAKSNGWGYVVETEDTRNIFKAIENIFNNTSVQLTLIKNAFSEARRRNATVYANDLLKKVQTQ